MSNSREIFVRGINPPTTLPINKIGEINKYLIYFYKKTCTRTHKL